MQGHITGQSFQALRENGADSEKRKSSELLGTIPFVENVPLEGVERFQQQLEIIDLIDSEDVGTINAKIQECVEKDREGALEVNPIVMEVDEEKKKLKIVTKKEEKINLRLNFVSDSFYFKI